MDKDSKLGLGGHSFIEQLGNDPQASFEEQCAIVSACLDEGIRVIDTTYYQERIALGKVLRYLGRRNEARIMAWNFFKQPGKEKELVGYTPYEPCHIDIMLEELQTEHIDILVIHSHGDADKLCKELELAGRWMLDGKVKKVGLGMVQSEHLRQLPVGHPITHVLAPYNAFNPGSKVFVDAKKMGMSAIALSPFIRGWKLDEIGGDKDLVAEVLLRWVAAQPMIDRVIVSMRKKEWVHSNLNAVERGPLTELEQSRLQEWIKRLS
ncbi:Predicted oxidoreductase [Paenibacillus sp. yr247]|uniref:aldo/keto reductase n=1 Tax=Paenibacillus sp. yr247 TaxID=1761880 RepID=UPI00088F0BF2|nr:aldo/keto reductase [Paenibacillus sp. yr247]SDN94739.1 Predicted oxidoreductase [Paenibacillus sp. yr247]